MVEPIKVSLEQPSPVSVLDATFYRDESPSPVKKKTSNVFKGRHLQPLFHFSETSIYINIYKPILMLKNYKKEKRSGM